MTSKSIAIYHSPSESIEIVRETIFQIFGKVTKEEARRIYWQYEIGIHILQCETHIEPHLDQTYITTYAYSETRKSSSKQVLEKFYKALWPNLRNREKDRGRPDSMSREKHKAKSLKLEKNEIVCTNCNTILSLSKEIQNDELIQCSKCEAAITNSLYFSGRSLICNNCGNNAELPKDLENELIVNCSVCQQDVLNPYSHQYNPLTCTHCYGEVHIPEEIIGEKYINCPFCENDFKNTLRRANNNHNRQLKENVNVDREKTRFESAPHKNRIEPQESRSSSFLKSITSKHIIIASIAFIVAIFLLTDSEDSSGAYSTNGGYYGAYTKEDFNRLMRYGSNNDEQAINQMYMNGRIIVIPTNRKAYLVEQDYGAVKIRLEGNTTEFWTVMEAITD